MDEREADERYDRLLANVAEARDLLREVGAEHWATWMAAVHVDLIAHDAHGLTHLLGAYGGMGSLNDLVILPANGHRVDADDVDRCNRTFAALRTAMYADSQALLRDLERAP